MGERSPRIAACPGIYVALVPILQRAARDFGYCLAVHGSLLRDLDLIAVPWIDEAADPEVLVEALAAACGGRLATLGDKCQQPTDQRAPATERPHGRRAWIIYLGGGAYLDLSVLPRVLPVPAGGFAPLSK